MSIPGSYANGFAPRDGQPLLPELWRGCDFAVAPLLGPTGNTLRDWAGRSNNGTLTNMDTGSDWIIFNGRHALDFGAGDDLVKCSSTSIGNIGAANCTIGMWAVLPDASVFGSMINKRQGSGTFQQWSITQGNLNTSFASVSNKKVAAFFYLSGSVSGSQHVVTVSDVADGKLHCIVVRRRNGVSPEIFIDGVNVAVTVIGATTTNINTDSTEPMRLGAVNDASAAPLAFTLLEARVWNYAKSDSLIRAFSQRPGIAYELAPRRRSRTFAGGFKAYWAARKAQIIGGGL